MQCKLINNCPTETPNYYRHPQDNPAFARGAMPCQSSCKDIRSGVFDFTGPALLIGLCNIHKSYLVEYQADNDCWLRVGAIFPDSKTKYLAASSMEFSLAGNYRVSYNWDACCQDEPQFVAKPHPCPCD